MNGKWEEAESRVVVLADDEPDFFRIYMSLVYTGKLPVSEHSADALPREGKKVLIREDYDNLFRLYALADKLQDTAAKNAADTAVFEVLEKERLGNDLCLPAFATMSMLYDRTPDGSPARKLVVDMANICNVEPLHDDAATLPTDMMRDLSVSLRMRVKGENGAIKKGLNAYLETTTEVADDEEEAENE